MGFHVIRLEAQRLCILGDRVVQPSRHLRPREAEVVVRFGVIRLEAQRLCVLGGRVIQPSRRP